MADLEDPNWLSSEDNIPPIHYPHEMAAMISL